ncbi:MAG: DUF2813 domain-containing protein [Calditrichaeota bacterium]|nr:MAG: DUF2813 domain-containing protein [Calditrichota bacterium]
MLDRIKIQNFKSIRELDLKLNDLNIFIGANGVGKSNFISVFKFLNKIISKNLQNYTAQVGGADVFLHFGRKNSNFLKINLDISDEKFKDRISVSLEPNNNDRFFIKQEFWGKDEIETSTKIKGSKHDWISNAPSESTLIAKIEREWKVYHFHDTSDSAKVKLTGDLEDNHFLRTDAGNLAAFLYLLQQKFPDHFKNIEETIKLVAPFFGKFNLQPSRLNEDKIQLKWKEVGSDDYFNASHLSDGTLRFICLATLLLQPELPSAIILDEPELGLHPYAINILASLIKSASTKTQVLVSTQSVTLVNQFEPKDLVVVDREDNQSVFKRLDEKEIENWLEDYALGELWEKNIFGGRP